MKKTIRLSQLAANLGLKFEGKDTEFDGLGLCNRKSPCKSLLSYVVNDRYITNIKENEAISCLVLSESLRNSYSEENIGRDISYIVSEKPEICFYSIHEDLCKSGELYECYDFEPVIGEDCHIAKTAVIEKGVVIGNYVTMPRCRRRPGRRFSAHRSSPCRTCRRPPGWPRPPPPRSSAPPSAPEWRRRSHPP